MPECKLGITSQRFALFKVCYLYTFNRQYNDESRWYFLVVSSTDVRLLLMCKTKMLTFKILAVKLAAFSEHTFSVLEQKQNCYCQAVYVLTFLVCYFCNQLTCSLVYDDKVYEILQCLYVKTYTSHKHDGRSLIVFNFLFCLNTIQFHNPKFKTHSVYVESLNLHRYWR